MCYHIQIGGCSSGKVTGMFLALPLPLRANFGSPSIFHAAIHNQCLQNINFLAFKENPCPKICCTECSASIEEKDGEDGKDSKRKVDERRVVAAAKIRYSNLFLPSEDA